MRGWSAAQLSAEDELAGRPDRYLGQVPHVYGSENECVQHITGSSFCIANPDGSGTRLFMYGGVAAEAAAGQSRSDSRVSTFSSRAWILLLSLKSSSSRFTRFGRISTRSSSGVIPGEPLGLSLLIDHGQELGERNHVGIVLTHGAL